MKCVWEYVNSALLCSVSKLLSIKFSIIKSSSLSPTLKAVEGGSVKSSSSIWMKGGFLKIHCLTIFVEAKEGQKKGPKTDLKPGVIAVGQNGPIVFCT